ncbi:hypothetical protein TCAL_10865 [Tigriopus californicus]|uniref:Amino acid permease/ SLC12A domain-containing protein n=1 Tax=Tigriopus californicus TaxID=6832 RepID=A0A553P2X0_TIGCA|nr:hypothetical protein TCAL_10865 [Tigriopus californicus]|eukprot:TCALIF_10865-PA protein Name:"Similar to Slc7a8 Large neutral amino acids transporter small subunit 2 (Mus musculus)" AED:0.30 eAED:0.30 QI:0/-1/0/1/-1/1/1/0/261
MLTVILVYALTIVAYLLVLTQLEILESNAIAMTFGFNVFPVLFWLMPAFVACSTIGNLNNGILLFPRFMMAGARQGHLPNVFSLLNVNYLTLIFNLFVSFLILSTASTYLLMQYMSYIGVIVNITSISTLIRRRLSHPDLPRQFRLLLVFPVFYWVIALLLLIFPLYAQPWTKFSTLVLIFSGTPVYLLLIYPKTPLPILKKLEKNVAHFCQKCVNALPEEYEKRFYFEDEKNPKGQENSAFKDEKGDLGELCLNNVQTIS